MGERSQFSVTAIVAMGIGTALYAVFTIFFNILQIPGTQLVAVRPSVAIPMFFGFLFGPLVGFISGCFGNIIADAVSWGGFWWNWDVGNGLMGMIPGIAYYIIKEKEELTSGKSIILAIILAIIGAVIGMAFAAYTDYIFGYGISTLEEATTILFIPAAATDAVNGAILTPVLVAAYGSAVKGRGRG